MFAEAVARRLKGSGKGSLRSVGAEGFVVAKAGVQFESSDLVASVVHALALGEPREMQTLDVASEVELFVDGRGAFADVIPALRAIGVYSTFPRERAAMAADWIRSIDPGQFATEVAEMHGPDAVHVYRAVAGSLLRTFESAVYHGADLCCLSVPEHQAMGGE